MSVVLINSYTFGSPTWTPANLTTALWLDADDSSTVTTSGGFVSQWNDKSGNGRNVSQSDTTLRPAYTANAVNGKYGITFDGLGDRLDTANGVLQLGSLSVFLLLKSIKLRGSIINVPNTLTFPASGAPSHRWAMYHDNGAQRDGLSTVINGIPYWASEKGLGADQTPHPGHMILSYVTGDNEGRINDRVVLSPTYFYQADSSIPPPAAGLTITYPNSTPLSIGDNIYGRGSGPGDYMQGDICEIVITPNAISTDNRLRMEGYLAHKWGITSKLAADHPYKTTAPTA